VAKTLLVTNDLGPRAGGIETFIHGLLHEISALPGNEVTIYTSHQDGHEQFDADLKARYGIDIYRDKSKMLLPTPRVNRAVKKIAQERDLTTIWFGALAPLGWMSGTLRRGGAERIVALTHGHEVWWSKLWLFSSLIRRMTKEIDIVTYLGSFTRSAMAPALNRSVELVRIAPGIDVEHFSPQNSREEIRRKFSLGERPIIISVGRLVPRKGQDRLIEALPQIVQAIPDVLLLIVGIGKYEKKLRALVAKNAMESHVIFVGRISYSELPSYLSAADLFAMPSRSRYFGLEVEGLGIVYLEASACGLPVLVGNSGGAPDAVLEGETGRVVDGRDVDAISSALIEMLSDPAALKKMGARGREWALSEWSWKIWGEKFRSVLFSPLK